MTDTEEGTADGTRVHGDFTNQACRAVWEPVNERLWIDADETERHRRVLDAVCAPIGVTERGRLRSVSRIESNLCRCIGCPGFGGKSQSGHTTGTTHTSFTS
ncbi:hypothetical protein ACFU9X_33255 [Streptomyces atratus]|uniref:hypothetical protein n=1 Tax=Streptomyces atratus TaxID=1893 RepID=UPI003687C39D